MSLVKELDNQKQQIKKRIPTFVFNYMNKLTRLLNESGIKNKAHGVGETLPNGVFMNHFGKEVILSDILQHKKAIVNFYRGSWCPYCNLELRAYTKLLQSYEETITMVAISPEKPDVTMEAVDIQSIGFEVLSDMNNEYAKKVGLVHETTALLRFLYRLDGINLKRSQGNDFGELPIPATYVVDSAGTIVYAYLDGDYTIRAEPSEVIEAYLKAT